MVAVRYSVLTVSLAALERGIACVPGQARAFDAHRELAHARQGGQLAEVLRHRRIVVGEHVVDLAVQVRDLVAVFALDGLAHHRGRSHGNRTSLAFEAKVAKPVAFEAHADVQPVAAQRIVVVDRPVGRIEAAEQPRTPVVIEDDVAIQILEVHQPNTSRALPSAATSASISDSRE
jgi:hypothetical protein